jgi:hypothetical protein
LRLAGGRLSWPRKDKFHLHRDFNFSTEAKVHVLAGTLPQVCRLDPVQYRASI